MKQTEFREPILRFFQSAHLPAFLRPTSQLFEALAIELHKLPRNAERSTALRKLLEAKDCAVRALLPESDAAPPAAAPPSEPSPPPRFHIGERVDHVSAQSEPGTVICEADNRADGGARYLVRFDGTPASVEIDADQLRTRAKP